MFVGCHRRLFLCFSLRFPRAFNFCTFDRMYNFDSDTHKIVLFCSSKTERKIENCWSQLNEFVCKFFLCLMKIYILSTFCFSWFVVRRFICYIALLFSSGKIRNVHQINNVGAISKSKIRFSSYALFVLFSAHFSRLQSILLRERETLMVL